MAEETSEKKVMVKEETDERIFKQRFEKVTAGEEFNVDDFVKIKIRPAEGRQGMDYIIIEPEMSKIELKLLSELKNMVMEKIEYDYDTMPKKKDPKAYIEEKLMEIIKEKEASEKFIGALKKFKYYIFRDFLGFGKIDPVMKDPNIEDVYCNGVNIPIFVRHKRYGALKTNVIFNELEDLEKFVMVLSQKCKRFITYAEPLLDSTLPDGSRLQATFGQDVTLRGPTFSIRKFQKLPLTPLQLIKFGTASPAVMAYFWLAMEHNISILIAGGSGSGKTTLTNAICMFIPPDYKIMSIEDTSELNLPHKNWVKAITRAGYGPQSEYGQRYGEVTMFDLLKSSLRQRPDYVLVGEVRGAEASVLFQGMASGHSSIGTIHAESLDAVVERLTTPPINLPPNLVELIDVVVLQILATSKGPSARRISKVIEIRDVAHGKPDVGTPFMWDPFVDSFLPIESFEDEKTEWISESFLIEKLGARTGKTKDELAIELRNREKIIKWMLKNDIISFHDVFNVISEYWYNPKVILKKVERGESGKEFIGKKAEDKEKKSIIKLPGIRRGKAAPAKIKEIKPLRTSKTKRARKKSPKSRRLRRLKKSGKRTKVPA